MQHQFIDLGGAISVEEHAFSGDGPAPATLVLVHGLGGSTIGWRPIQAGLAAHGRVLSFDFPGHGRSPREGRSTVVGANALIVERFLDTETDGPVMLVGNSMGGLISLMVAARRELAGLVLINPAVPGPFELPRPDVAFRFLVGMVPGIAPRLVALRRERAGHEESVRQTMRMITAPGMSVDEDVILEGARNLGARGPGFDGDRAFVQASRSTVASAANRRFVDPLAAAVSAPTLLLHGQHDPLVSVRAARRLHALRPDWTLEVHPEVGHVPQLEDPDWTLRMMGRWLGDVLPASPASA